MLSKPDASSGRACCIIFLEQFVMKPKAPPVGACVIILMTLKVTQSHYPSVSRPHTLTTGNLAQGLAD
jgi:hypothetical protein